MAMPWWPELGLGLLLGLVVGSFLNVLIHRLPRMMEARWQQDMAQWLAEQEGPAGAGPAAESAAKTPTYNLAHPSAHCPACKHRLRWYENIPLLSFVALRGRCSACGQRIAWRYPLVELTTGVLFAACLYRWGLTPAGWLWCGFCAVLLALACIDQDTQLLPDDLTQPLLWAGLVVAALELNAGVTLVDALWGSVAGYLSLWLVYHGFLLLTGKEGMGHGDFKLLAALGAWLGWQALLPVVLLASVSGAVVGLGLRATGRLQAGQAMPFGPYLVAGGLVSLLAGPRLWTGWLGGAP